MGTLWGHHEDMGTLRGEGIWGRGDIVGIWGHRVDVVGISGAGTRRGHCRAGGIWGHGAVGGGHRDGVGITAGTSWGQSGGGVTLWDVGGRRGGVGYGDSGMGTVGWGGVGYGDSGMGGMGAPWGHCGEGAVPHRLASAAAGVSGSPESPPSSSILGTPRGQSCPIEHLQPP